jgi:hypothetical protein
MNLRIFSTEWLTRLIGTTEFDSKTKTVFQTKTMTVNATALGTITELTFNNLQAGKFYRVSGLVSFVNVNIADDPRIYFNNTNGMLMSYLGVAGNAVAGYNLSASPCFVFQAASNGSMTVEKEFATGIVSIGSYITLEELPNHTVTAQWT